MHMADALLSPAVGLSAGAGVAGLIAYAARRASADPQHLRRIPLMGVMAAFVFAAQMINFAIPGTGSSGHIAGGLLLAILLGPNAAFIAMASVLSVQCLLFADGGLLALGCNILNLGFWPCFVGLPVYRAIGGALPDARRAVISAVIAAVISLQLGAAGVVIETVLSGRSELPFAKFGAVMLGIHLPIGIVEGLVTAGVLRAVSRTATQAPEPVRETKSLLAGIGIVALLMSGVLAWFASTKPDGLEWSLARVTGQTEMAAPQDSVRIAPHLGLSLARMSGAIVAGVIVCALGFAASRRNKPRAAAP